jgi:XRE family transcriptional regulator, regulator of sulfur utilization
MSWSFGKRIKIARVERHMSQKALADAAHVRQSHLSMIENAHHYPNVGVVRKLAHALGVNTEYLLGLGQDLRQVTYAELEEEDRGGSLDTPDVTAHSL